MVMRVVTVDDDMQLPPDVLAALPTLGGGGGISEDPGHPGYYLPGAGSGTGGGGTGGAVSSVNGKTGAVSLVKADLGLGGVDNTADVSKPVSTAQLAALNLKVNALDAALGGNPTATTQTPGTNNTRVATTAFVTAAIAATPAPVAVPELSITVRARIYAAVAKRDTAPVVMVSMGSSTTVGSVTTVLANSFTHRLAACMQASWPLASGGVSPTTRLLSTAVATPPSLPGVQVVNAGVSGSTSATYLTPTLIGQIAALHPRVLIHMVGSNDYLDGTNPATYQATLSTQLTNLNAALNSASALPYTHLFIHSYARLDAASPPFAWSAYLAAVQNLAATDPTRVAVLDLSTAYAGIGINGAGSADPYGFMADTVHNNDAGHSFMADLIRAALRLPARIAAAGWTVFTSDTFTGADALDLDARVTDCVLGGTPTAWLGSATQDSMAVVSTSLRPGLGTTAKFNGVVVPSKDQRISATFTALSSAEIWLSVRRTSISVSTAYRIQFIGTAAVLQRTITSTPTTIGSFTIAVGNRVTLDVRGTVVTCQINGVVVLSVNDTVIPGADLTTLAGVSTIGTSTGYILDDVVIEYVTDLHVPVIPPNKPVT